MTAYLDLDGPLGLAPKARDTGLFQSVFGRPAASASGADLPSYPRGMAAGREVEFVFEPVPDGGYHAYAPTLPGLHSKGGTLEEAMANAQEALELYVKGLREEGRSLDMGVVRRRLPLPA